MKLPNHIVLDFESNSTPNSNQYWAINFLEQSLDQPAFMQDIKLTSKYYRKFRPYRSSKLVKNPMKYTVRPNFINHTCFKPDEVKDTIKEHLMPFVDLEEEDSADYYLKYSKETGRDSYMYLTLSALKYSRHNVEKTFNSQDGTPDSFDYALTQNNTWYNLVNVNFLRKERLYTKLKYSRTPAYDIVSGGAAALLAGFVGFLVSEKFGFELVDSGDFYFFFMYLVFATFSIRPLLLVANPEKGFIHMFSLRRVVRFYRSVAGLLLNNFR